MSNDRRKFLKYTGLASFGMLALPFSSCNSDASSTTTTIGHNSSPQKIGQNFGIQLYTLRDIINENPKNVLKQLAQFGFTQIESYESEQGIFCGMGHKGFKEYLDSIGITMIASHCDIYKNFEEKAAQAAEIGMKYLVCPYVGPQTSKKKWQQITDKFNACGEICRKNGIRFAYHNHAYSFKAFSGMIPQDFIMENTDPDLVDHEMDIYWVVTGGANPIDYLKKYPNRFRLCHIKDRAKNAAADNEQASCDLGTGSIDFPSILDVAAQNGMEYFFLEQEKYENSSPIQCAEVGANYLKKLKIG